MNRAHIAMAAGVALLPVRAVANCKLTQIAELKVSMDGPRPMITAQINGHDAKFLVDSGAFFSMITPGTAVELGLKLKPTEAYMQGIGGAASISIATVKKFGLVGGTLNDIPFVVGGSEVGGAGVIGQNVLGFADVEYDFPHGAVRLMRPAGCTDFTVAYWAGDKPISVLSIEARDQDNLHTAGIVTVNGVRLNATFDTGASYTAMSLSAAKRAGIAINGPEVKRASFGGSGVGRRIVATFIVPVENITIGTEQVRKTHLFAQLLPPDTDMLIGADFFLSPRAYVATGMRKLFFTYEGGPIFGVAPSKVLASDGSVSAAPKDNSAEPTDAEGWSRRGAALLARDEHAKGMAAIDKAVALAPTQSRYVFQRADAHMTADEPLLAMDDLDRTLKPAPGDAEARLMRASIRISRHDRSAAEDDLAALDRVLPAASDHRIELGGLYDSVDQPGKAIPQYDQWIRYHPDDNKRPSALNGRCWARALLGSDLPKALSDCDSAIRARPQAAGFLDSRALVYFRMGSYAKALRDYDAALALEPKLAWSKYCRGLTRQRLGQKQDGAADIAAATKLDAAVPVRAHKLGLES